MGRRIALYIVIGLLLVALLLAGARLPGQLRAAMVAEADDPYWPVFQLETEMANLAAVLADPDTDDIRLRADIALSRITIVERRLAPAATRTGELRDYLDMLAVYEAEAIALLDGGETLSEQDVAVLRARTAEVRPEIRRLSVLAVNLRAAAAAQERRALARMLMGLAVAVLVVIGLLIATLVYLQRSLANAQAKDAQILETTDRLASTVSASLDGIIVADDAGRIVEFNPAASKIFGWERTDILGMSMDDTIVPHQHRQAHSAGMQRYLSTKVPHVIDAGRIELSALRKTGEEFPIELNITTTKQGGRDFFIGYARDISQQKINEQNLIDSRDRAEKADRAKSRFLTVMSHEMRTPLNGILGVLDLLMKTALKPQQERYVKVAAASSEILLESVNEALDITRIETGVMTLSPELFSLRATVHRVADVLRTLANEKGLTLDVTFDPSMDQKFVADGGRINQILTNLIGNAVKFTESGGIEVRVTGIHGPEETVASILVADTGPGIPVDMHEAIFEDFIALARAEGRQSRSDGLGLSIARKMARLMGGDLGVESDMGQGSAFTLKLPMRRALDEEPKRAVSRSLPTATEKSVLIVEDNAVNRSVLHDMLIGLGHRVTEAGNGLAALKTAADDRFDLIVMDISMPFMDGIEATRRIRTDAGPNKDTFILGLTAHGRDEFRQRAEAAGMDGFCTKPIRLTELEAALSADLERPGAQQTRIAVIDHDVLSELRRAVGQQKLGETTNRFFEELDATLVGFRSGLQGADGTTASAAIHKVRGAAVMLGFNALDDALRQLGEAAKAGRGTAFEAALAATSQSAATARNAFNAMDDMPKG